MAFKPSCCFEKTRLATWRSSSLGPEWCQSPEQMFSYKSCCARAEHPIIHVTETIPSSLRVFFVLMSVMRGLWAKGTSRVLFLLGVHTARPFSNLSGPWDGITAIERELLLGLARKSRPHNPLPPLPPPSTVKTLQEDVATGGRSFDP